MCGINALGVQWCGCIFMLCYTNLNLALLLHKTVLVMFLLASTVCGTAHGKNNKAEKHLGNYKWNKSNQEMAGNDDIGLGEKSLQIQPALLSRNV